MENYTKTLNMGNNTEPVLPKVPLSYNNEHNLAFYIMVCFPLIFFFGPIALYILYNWIRQFCICIFSGLMFFLKDIKCIAEMKCKEKNCTKCSGECICTHKVTEV